VVRILRTQTALAASLHFLSKADHSPLRARSLSSYLYLPPPSP
jgi:hypothetical protein